MFVYLFVLVLLLLIQSFFSDTALMRVMRVSLRFWIIKRSSIVAHLEVLQRSARWRQALSKVDSHLWPISDRLEGLAEFVSQERRRVYIVIDDSFSSTQILPLSKQIITV